MKILVNFVAFSCLFVTLASAACTKTLKCVDCNKFEICVGNSTTTSSCPSSQRYCTTGVADDFCSSTLESGNTACNSVTKNFQCTRPGYFPSPYNCSEYFECFYYPVEESNIELIFFKKTCNEKYYYNSKQKMCVKQTSAAQCTSVSCTTSNLGFFPYKADTQYYHFCAEDIASNDVLMFRCDDGETFTAESGCRFHCPAIGRYAHEDVTKYYECTAAGVNNYTIGKCWSGVFDKVTKKCNFVY
ncbi:uncharacterized protein LOC134837436 [Culicoides brevitarsis]|uniref:uncharacterized protein LOC134837436 n=1 Tax=Culicoides brevitarsis TaxID=469753 RepID=UPI00307BDC3C